MIIVLKGEHGVHLAYDENEAGALEKRGSSVSAGTPIVGHSLRHNLSQALAHQGLKHFVTDVVAPLTAMVGDVVYVELRTRLGRPTD